MLWKQIFHDLSSVRKIVNNYFWHTFSWTRSEIKDNNSALYEQESVEEEMVDILTSDK